MQWGDEGRGRSSTPYCPGRHCCPQSGRQQCGHTVIYRGVKYVLHLTRLDPSAQQNLCDWKRRCCRSGRARRRDRRLRKLGIRIDKNLLISDALTLSCLITGNWTSNASCVVAGLERPSVDRPGLWRQSRRTGCACPTDAADRVSRETASEGYREHRILRRWRKADKFWEVSKIIWQPVEKLRPFVTNTVVYSIAPSERDKKILFEGAQGTFLDIDHGTYPM